MLDLFNESSLSKEKSQEHLIQNSLPCKAPDYCYTPFWYVHGLEKKVKIGRESFNYIDYLEAWCNIDCGTYRSRDTLESIYRQIEKAFFKAEQGI